MTERRRSYLLPLAIGIAIGVALGWLVFHERAYLASWRLDSDQTHLWETVLKAVAGYLALSGALVTVLKYLDEKAEHTEIAQRESRKDFLAKRQEVYFRLVQVIAEIVNQNPGSDGWDPAVRSFWKIYWGEIVLVSDKPVAEAVESFSDALWNYKGDEEKLSGLGMVVARACRTSLGETWNFEQAPIPQSPFRSILQRFRSASE